MATAAAVGALPTMTPIQRILAGAVLSMANFMVILDLTIANVSVPHISGDLGITMDQGTWIISSYAVAEAICVPLTGWLAQRFGSVRVFVASMFGFGLFSLLCGMSVTLEMLVFCRIGQGVCGAPIMPMSQALLIRIFPPESRAKAMGFWAMTVMVAPALGPILGGVISDTMSWHWIFLINVPIAAAMVLGGYALLRPAETETLKLPIDRVGLVLLIFWIACLQLMLDIGRDHDWFNDPTIVALAIMAAIGLMVFVIWELTEEHPVVDLRIFRYRGFTFSVVAFGLAYGGFFAATVVIPQWLQSAMGYSATQAGMVTALQAVSAFVAAGLVPRLMPKSDLRYLVAGGIAWMGLIALVRAGWTSGADYWSIAWPIFIQGFGIPFMAIPLTTMSLSVVRPDEVNSAAGLQIFIRTMSLAMSTSLSVTIWNNNQRFAQTEIASNLHPDAAQSVLGGLGMGADQVRQVVSGIVEKEAVTAAMDELFLATGTILFVASLIVLLAPKPKAMGLKPDASAH